MNRNGTDGIVDMSNIIIEPNTEYYEYTGYSADDGCACTVGNVTGSGDRNKARK